MWFSWRRFPPLISATLINNQFRRFGTDSLDRRKFQMFGYRPPAEAVSRTPPCAFANPQVTSAPVNHPQGVL